jgi:hypothetical protein
MPGVYPRGLPWPFEAQVGDIRVRSLSFSLDVDVDEAVIASCEKY